MVFLGTVFKTRLKYSKELLTIMLKIQKLTLWIINWKNYNGCRGVLEKSFPWNESPNLNGNCGSIFFSGHFPIVDLEIAVGLFIHLVNLMEGREI